MTHLFLMCLVLSFFIIVLGKLIGTMIISIAMKKNSKYKRFTLLQTMLVDTEFLPPKLYDRLVYNGDLTRSTEFSLSTRGRVRRLNVKDPGLVVGGRKATITIQRIENLYHVIYQPKGKPLRLKPATLQDLDKIIETFSNIEYNLNFNNDIEIYL